MSGTPGTCPDCGKPYEDCDAYLREEGAANGVDPSTFCHRGAEHEKPTLRVIR